MLTKNGRFPAVFISLQGIRVDKTQCHGTINSFKVPTITDPKHMVLFIEFVSIEAPIKNCA